MQLTKKQAQGLAIAIERYRHGEPYTCIAGYAGTGKSTLVRFIIEALELDPQDVAYVAFTGKAAKVLRDKGNPGAITAHKLLYEFQFNRADMTYTAYPRLPGNLDGDYKLIVVDEVSMLPKTMWNLLLSHGIYVIACGDPAQLSPVSNDFNDVLQHPHVFLDEIMRQALDNEIIRFSMDIRNHKPLKPYKGQQVQILPKKELCDGMLFWADQVLCATNNTRFYLNDRYRQILWKEQYSQNPLIGDKIIGLKNDWKLLTHAGEPFTNGTLCNIVNIDATNNSYYGGKKMYFDLLPVQYDVNDVEIYDLYAFQNILIDYKLLTKNVPLVSKQNYSFHKKNMPHEVAYGYAITTWKAQGSEFNKVLLLEENFPFDKEERWRYLYTGITRASEKAIIILNK